ncbi:M23 family metallopeptidase [Alkalibacillus haloalkaliphilus]|uniref:M23 family metallopeptidase n=1 Tax=Alkalibacillus haloalkaliphilus TaxID=94136 RepID=UPI00036B8590|nr:M23 family metallopeptidase [Alkalibacillus haloalkaliphilus]
MSRKLNEIRHSISKRKKTQRSKLDKDAPYLPSREESHGYMPLSEYDSQGFPKVKASLMSKLLLSAFIFFITFFIYYSPAPWMNQAQNQVHGWLTEDMPFATVQAWYDSHFSSLFVSTSLDQPASQQDQMVDTVPVSGLHVDRVTEASEGVYIEVHEEKGVYPVERGTVLFAGNMPDTGRTIIVQHESGEKTVYGNLAEIDVFHYQFVDPTKKMATVKPDELVGYSNLYFAVQDGEDYIDPLQVILGD